MTRLTKAQQRALKAVHNRPLAGPFTTQISYRAFRYTVQPIFACPGAVCVPWCGMWLAIEPDGYTHS